MVRRLEIDILWILIFHIHYFQKMLAVFHWRSCTKLELPDGRSVVSSLLKLSQVEWILLFQSITMDHSRYFVLSQAIDLQAFSHCYTLVNLSMKSPHSRCLQFFNESNLYDLKYSKEDFKTNIKAYFITLMLHVELWSDLHCFILARHEINLNPGCLKDWELTWVLMLNLNSVNLGLFHSKLIKTICN